MGGILRDFMQSNLSLAIILNCGGLARLYGRVNNQCTVCPQIVVPSIPSLRVYNTRSREPNPQVAKWFQWRRLRVLRDENPGFLARPSFHVNKNFCKPFSFSRSSEDHRAPWTSVWVYLSNGPGVLCFFVACLSTGLASSTGRRSCVTCEHRAQTRNAN